MAWFRSTDTAGIMRREAGSQRPIPDKPLEGPASAGRR